MLTGVIRNPEMRNMSQVEFGVLKRNFVQYLAAILLLDTFVEDREWEEELEGDEWEPIPSDEEEGEQPNLMLDEESMAIA